MSHSKLFNERHSALEKMLVFSVHIIHLHYCKRVNKKDTDQGHPRATCLCLFVVTI